MSYDRILRVSLLIAANWSKRLCANSDNMPTNALLAANATSRASMMSASLIEEGRVWGSAPWECLALTMADIHDDLVTRLAPRRGERWLDVATGTGAVALRAARSGAEVTAQDIAPRLLDWARSLAAAEGLTVAFDVGDVADLPYADRSFDVVSSAHGVSFAADHEAAAAELARVCRPSGRLGLTDWLPDCYPDFEEMLARFRDPDAGGGVRRHNWGASRAR